jgi:hypothetical protein
VLFQPNVDVDPISPHVDIVDPGQVAFGEGALLSLPLLGQAGDDRSRQAGRRAEELPERGHEVPRRQSVQIQQRQHLGQLGGLAAPRRQDRRGKTLALAGVAVDTLVVDPRHLHLHRSGRGEDFARLVVAVADDQTAAVLVALVGERRDVGIDLGLQRLGQHPAGALPHDLIDQRRRRTGLAGLIALRRAWDYGEHLGVPSRPTLLRRPCLRTSCDPGRYTPFPGDPQVSSIAPYVEPPSQAHSQRATSCRNNGHRPHQGIANARPLYPLPAPIADPDQIARLNIRRHQRLGGILHEYQHAA